VVVARGFSAFKWSPFTVDRLRAGEDRAIADAAALMHAARESVGSEFDIFVECGEKFSARTAIAAARAFAPYRPGWFEEPLPFENSKAMIQLQRELGVPIATGERLLSRWEYRELIENGGCSIIQPDLTHAGGITEVRRIATMADTYYISVAPHNSAGPIGTLAALHLAASIPNFLILEQMEEERELRDQLVTEPLQFGGGYFELPTGPGLGTDLRMDRVVERGWRPLPVKKTSEPIWR
jgi:galactonate dehydratase